MGNSFLQALSAIDDQLRKLEGSNQLDLSDELHGQAHALMNAASLQQIQEAARVIVGPWVNFVHRDALDMHFEGLWDRVHSAEGEAA